MAGASFPTALRESPYAESSPHSAASFPTAYRERSLYAEVGSYSATSYSSLSTTSYSSSGPDKYDRLVDAFKNFLAQRDLAQSMKPVVSCLDSGPFINVCIVSLKNLPYVTAGQNRSEGSEVPSRESSIDLDSEISGRLRYAEAAMMAAAGVVSNFAFASAFSVASLATLIPGIMTAGQKKMVTDQMHKLWLHTAFAMVSCGIGVVGAVMPKMGILANLASVAQMASMLEDSEPTLFRDIYMSYHEHKSEFVSVAKDCCGGDGELYHSTFHSFFDTLDAHLTNDKSLEDFFAVIMSASRDLPDNMLKAFGFKLFNSIVGLLDKAQKDYGPQVDAAAKFLTRLENMLKDVWNTNVEQFNSSEYGIMIKEKFNSLEITLRQTYRNWAEKGSREGVGAPSSSSPSSSGIPMGGVSSPIYASTGEGEFSLSSRVHVPSTTPAPISDTPPSTPRGST